jgi:CHAT domain-containing protein
VQAALTEDTALVELAVFHPFDPEKESDAEANGPPHYAAYVIRKDRVPHGVDLGPVAEIDREIEALRQALADPTGPNPRRPARAVDARVMQPLRAALGDVTRVLVSPDGALNLVPFDALVDDRGQFLIQRYAISYLTSGRDLLRLQVGPVNRSHGNPVIIANPLFGEPPGPSTPTIAAARTRRRSVTSGETLSAMYFGPLAGSASEARALKTLFPESSLYTGRNATKTVLLHVEAPLLLHIASHGFFLRQEANPGTSENPLLRSGLALAGANLSAGSPDAGILTALEASGLNLWGTQLVTLSACDTGVGEVRNGEGVYGLRRAFVLAGAHTLVMSLWTVSDYITRDMMITYYKGLRDGMGRGDALRRAKLEFLSRPGRQHPFYWASFIQSGEWATLSGRR